MFLACRFSVCFAVAQYRARILSRCLYLRAGAGVYLGGRVSLRACQTFEQVFD
jgi:hypothetical protein